MKNLPIGISTFEIIRQYDYVYIDKTHFIYELTRLPGRYFLSRPRRFGKSLLIDTFKDLFEGKKELFQNLFIYPKWDWNKKYPVLKIDFSDDHSSSSDILKSRIQKNLQNLVQEHDLNLTLNNTLTNNFHDIIHATYKKYQQKVVILVDEYDKGILDCITDTPTATANRELLKGFYSVIKANDALVQFAFLTGVSKFSKTSIFSRLNNLNDITLNPSFANICSYTHHDLISHFSDYLHNVDLQELQRWYNGYCCDIHKPKVYNPFNILQFFSNNNQFKNYWFDTGTPSFLIKLILQNEYYLPNSEQLITDESLLSTFDTEKIPIISLLWQTGYLTIENSFSDETGIIQYQLNYPNFEVQYSLNKFFVNFLSEHPINNFVIFRKMLLQADFDSLQNLFKNLFANISFSLSQHIKNYEGFYASVIYAFLVGLSLHCKTEDHTSFGRIDLTLFTHNKIFLFEFKMKHHHQSPLQQIKSKKYYEKYLNLNKEIYLIGIIFDLDTQNILTFEWEKL